MTPDFTVTVLLDITFEAGLLRSGEDTGMILSEVDMPPGYRLDARYLCESIEVLVSLPLDGALAVTVSGESFFIG